MSVNPRRGNWPAALLFTVLAITVTCGLTITSSYLLAKHEAQRNAALAQQAIELLNFDNLNSRAERIPNEMLEAHRIDSATVSFVDREPLRFESTQPGYWWTATATIDSTGAENSSGATSSVSSVSVTSSAQVHPPWLSLFILAGFLGYIIYATCPPEGHPSKTSSPSHTTSPADELPPTAVSTPAYQPTESTPAPGPQMIQSELALAQQSAIEANRFKSRLIANVSHEILTPLNSVLGFANLLKNKITVPGSAPLNADEQDTLTKLELIITNAEHIDGLINDLVVLSHENRRGLQLNYSEINVGELISDVAASFEHEVDSKGLHLEICTSDVGDLTLDTDPLRLRQILYNLLANAVRYTQEGSVAVTATVDNSATPSSFIIKIADTGPGIDEDKLPLLFSAFVRGRESAKADQPGLGLGLGLSIVQALTQLLNATIGVESSPGKGSTFTLTLPFRNLSGNTLSKHTPDRQPSLKSTPTTLNLLVVDDMPVNALLVEEQLKGYNCNITVAHNGNDALELTRSRQFDAVLLDIRMQPMSGEQILAEIKKNDRYATTPIIAFTAHKSEYDNNQLIKIGFADVIHKPVYQETLVKTLNLQVAGKSTIERTQQKSTVKPAERPGNRYSDITVFDAQLALKKCGGNAESASRIAALVVEEMREKSADYKRGKLGSGETLIDNIHRLNGTAALSGTPQLKDTINELESVLVAPGNNGKNTEVDTLIQNLFTDIDAFLEWAKSVDFDRLFEQESE